MPATIEGVKKLVADQQRAAKAETEKKPASANPNAQRFKDIENAVTTCREEGYEPGERMAIQIIALARAEGNPERALGIIREKYKQPEMVSVIERTMSQQSATEGGYLVPERWSDEIIPFIRDQALLPSLMPRIIENPTGDLSMARHSAAAGAYWKPPEGGKIKTTKPKFGRLRLRDKAAAALVPVTNKLMRNVGQSLVTFIEDELRAAVAVLVDTASWFGQGGEDEPGGLFTKIIKMTGASGVNISDLSTFDKDSLVKVVLAHMEAKGTAVNLQWAFGPAVWAKLMMMAYTVNGMHVYRDEMSRGTLLGIPFKWGNIIKRKDANTGYLALADWNEYIFAPSRPIELARSTEAAYYDEDGNITASFGNDETVIRVVWGGDMGPRRLQSFTLSDNVDISGL